MLFHLQFAALMLATDRRDMAADHLEKLWHGLEEAIEKDGDSD